MTAGLNSEDPVMRRLRQTATRTRVLALIGASLVLAAFSSPGWSAARFHTSSAFPDRPITT